MSDSYSFQGVHHVHWYVGNAYQSAYYFQKAWGFNIVAYAGLETGRRDVTSVVLQQGKIRIILTAPQQPGGEINAFLDRHGDGVCDVAFRTDNASAAFRSAIQNGAEPVSDLITLEDDFGELKMASIKAYDDVRHSLVEVGDYSGPFMPGYEEYHGLKLATDDIGLLTVDHVVHNMPDGEMENQVNWYQNILGFHRFWTVDDKDVSTEFSSLRSIVVANENRSIKMPVNEPADGLKKSQIQEFIDYNIDAGVQHVAMLTGDIIATVAKLRQNGVEFLEIPDSYYSTLEDRIGPIEEDFDTLREAGILVDRDDDGYLLQLFTKPIQNRPTFFFEVIQRKGSQSFGKGNFKALFESIEREQARRGNL